MSLDGYITGPNEEIDWIAMDPDIDFNLLTARYDTVILGRKSYEAAKQYGGAGMPGMQTYVFSKTLRPEDCPGAILSDNAEATVRALREKDGKDIWLFGGGVLFRSLLGLGLVDSVEVAVMPVLLGDGLPLLPHPSDKTKLKLTSHRIYEKTGTVFLEYAVIRDVASQPV